MSILIQHGTLICPEGPVNADLRVEGDKITEIGPGLPVGDSQVIDATGKLVFPGFIDTHTHFEMNRAPSGRPPITGKAAPKPPWPAAPPACWTLPSRSGGPPSSPPWTSGTPGPTATPAATTASI